MVTSVSLWHQPRVQKVFVVPTELKRMSEFDDLQKDRQGLPGGIDMKEQVRKVRRGLTLAVTAF